MNWSQPSGLQFITQVLIRGKWNINITITITMSALLTPRLSPFLLKTKYNYECFLNTPTVNIFAQAGHSKIHKSTNPKARKLKNTHIQHQQPPISDQFQQWAQRAIPCHPVRDLFYQWVRRALCKSQKKSPDRALIFQCIKITLKLICVIVKVDHILFANFVQIQCYSGMLSQT